MLSSHQRAVLRANFEKNPVWDQERINALSEQLDLTRLKVYKWNWDHRRKKYIDSLV